MSDKKIKDLEELIGKQYQRILGLAKLANEAIVALEVKGFGVTAHALRQELNKLKP